MLNSWSYLVARLGCGTRAYLIVSSWTQKPFSHILSLSLCSLSFTNLLHTTHINAALLLLSSPGPGPRPLDCPGFVIVSKKTNRFPGLTQGLLPGGD
jgi:hypothetical protein